MIKTLGGNAYSVMEQEEISARFVADLGMNTAIVVTGLDWSIAEYVMVKELSFVKNVMEVER